MTDPVDVIIEILVFVLEIVVSLALAALGIIALCCLLLVVVPLFPTEVTIRLAQVPFTNCYVFFYIISGQFYAAKSNVNYFVNTLGTVVESPNIVRFDSEDAKRRFQVANGLRYEVPVAKIFVSRLFLEKTFNLTGITGTFRDSRSYSTHVLDTLGDAGYVVSSKARDLLVPYAMPQRAPAARPAAEEDEEEEEAEEEANEEANEERAPTASEVFKVVKAYASSWIWK